VPRFRTIEATFSEFNYAEYLNGSLPNTAEERRCLLKEGGTARRAAVEINEELGRTPEAFYFALRRQQAYVITEGPG